MVNFRALLSAEALAELDAKRREISRMNALGDRWLAEELLSLVRLVRTHAEERLGQARYVECRTYDTSFVWGLVPEIAFRLGATRFVPGERQHDYSSLSGPELRDWVGQSFQWISRDIGMPAEVRVRGVKPWELLTTEFVNGNPVAFALDRVSPPGPESEDWCAVHMREIAGRRGFGRVSAWSPELNGRADSAEADEAPARVPGL